MNLKKGRVYIGTSNVVLPGNKLTFPEAYQSKSRLLYYSSIFNSVEINSSFYKLPLPATFKKWENEVGQDFLFSVKLSKAITHDKALIFDGAIIEQYMKACNELGGSRGCLLIQFPGKAGLDYYNKLSDILETIKQYDVHKQWHIAVEFRNKEWYVRETIELLQSYKACIVLQDMPKSRYTIAEENASFVYVRFHGANGDYRGSYSNKELMEYARKIQDWQLNGKIVYAYFNNTIGDAYQNALTLKKYIDKKFT